MEVDQRPWRQHGIAAAIEQQANATKDIATSVTVVAAAAAAVASGETGSLSDASAGLALIGRHRPVDVGLAHRSRRPRPAGRAAAPGPATGLLRPRRGH